MAWKAAVLLIFACLAFARPSGARDPVAPVMPPLLATRTVFSVSWLPGFCETRAKRPECREQTAERFDARHFTLHGLWPVKKRFCGVSADLRRTDRRGRWLELPAVDLSKATAERLATVMPGIRSGLDRHQWLASGTCQPLSPEAYFARQIAFLDRLNASPVRALFESRLGMSVRQEEVAAAFAEAFGDGAGTRIRLRCARDGSRTVITGMTIGLGGEGGLEGDMAELILASAQTRGTCLEGVVDAAGLQ
ncbi:ribonuclease T2 family protein [Ensifer soli]|uniref:ribonuclease T2 family protein n=1 Tax=Ciceribacter sp. sgz301302 TaxID=3342379 RepID=UPI0035BB779A